MSVGRKNHVHDCWPLMGMTGGGAWAYFFLDKILWGGGKLTLGKSNQ